MNRNLLWLMIVTSALTVGNVYYSQPLLGKIAETFQQPPATVGLVPFLTQLGYVVGLFFLTPLGDVTEKRRLLISLLFLAAVAMLGCALSTNFSIFALFSFTVGLTAVQAQIMIPFVASLSTSRDRSKNLGLVISACLLGILLSRTLSGFIGAHLSWRGMYYFGSGLMLLLAAFLRGFLPLHPSQVQAEGPLSYPRLIHSLWKLFRALPELRSIALTGAFIYGAFSTFWASLAFYLQSDTFHLGPDTVGAFGVVGAAGAMAANLTGRFINRIGARRLVLVCMGAMILSYLIMGTFSSSLIPLVMGVILLDVGAQSASISNQTELYRLSPHAQTRLNTIYKIFYFIGGASGSALSAWAWQQLGWVGVCLVGLLFLTSAWLNHSLSTWMYPSLNRKSAC